MDFHHIEIVQFVIPADGLAIDDAGAPDAGVFERLGQVLMDRFGEVDDRAAIGHGERVFLHKRFALLLTIDSNETEQLEDIRFELLETDARGARKA